MYFYQCLQKHYVVELDQEAVVEMVVGQREWEAQESVRIHGVCFGQWHPISW